MYDILPHIFGYYSKKFFRLISGEFKRAYDNLYKRSWNYTKICMNLQHAMDIKPMVADVKYMRIQPWVYRKIPAYLYPQLLHSKMSLKLCFTMYGMVVRTDELHKLDMAKLVTLDWPQIVNKDFDEEIISEYLQFIDNWDNVTIVPSINLINKCHNLSMLKYLDKSLDIYPHLNADTIERFYQHLDWYKVARFNKAANWIKFADRVDWPRMSRCIFACELTAPFIDWQIYSRHGLSDEDFKRRAHLIHEDEIVDVCLKDHKLYENHMAKLGKKVAKNLFSR